MNAERLTFDCAFLNDTQMADLAREQSSFAMALSRPTSRSCPAWLPFRLMQPFCPILDAAGRIRVGTSVAIGGWIIRPASFDAAPGIYEPPILPGYPPLPPVPGFIMGYAGTDHARIQNAIAQLSVSQVSDTVGEISANAWYSARVTLDIVWEEGKSYCVTRETGSPCWKKKP